MNDSELVSAIAKAAGTGVNVQISKNSLNYNRELGVLISGSEDNQLFYDTFSKDWKNPSLQQ
ncbi:MAG: hypothetical protein AAFV25_19725, partial [Bacteroidota bacterium]